MKKTKQKKEKKNTKSRKKSVKKINANMTIIDILEKKPESAEILFQSGLACIGCHMSGYETLKQGCKVHGMSNKEINELVKVINGKNDT